MFKYHIIQIFKGNYSIALVRRANTIVIFMGRRVSEIVIERSGQPLSDDWMVIGSPVEITGGGIQLFVNDSVKISAVEV